MILLVSSRRWKHRVRDIWYPCLGPEGGVPDYTLSMVVSGGAWSLMACKRNRALYVFLSLADRCQSSNILMCGVSACWLARVLIINMRYTLSPRRFALSWLSCIKTFFLRVHWQDDNLDHTVNRIKSLMNRNLDETTMTEQSQRDSTRILAGWLLQYLQIILQYRRLYLATKAKILLRSRSREMIFRSSNFIFAILHWH